MGVHVPGVPGAWAPSGLCGGCRTDVVNVLAPLLALVRRHLGLVLALALGLAVTAGAAFAALEERAVTSFGEGVWWAISLMTTVGFVGESPQTTGGRIVAGVLMLVGFALLSLVTAAVSSLFVRQDDAPAEAAVSRELTELAAAVRVLTEQQRELHRLLEQREQRDQRGQRSGSADEGGADPA